MAKLAGSDAELEKELLSVIPYGTPMMARRVEELHQETRSDLTLGEFLSALRSLHSKGKVMFHEPDSLKWAAGGNYVLRRIS